MFKTLLFSFELYTQVKGKTSAAEQMVGKCFLKHSERMKRVYTDYCVNKEKAEQLLEKYDQFPDIQRTLQKGVETIQSQVACFNIGSILIKPVQRILQYPLFLDKLIKVSGSLMSFNTPSPFHLRLVHGK